MNEKLIKSLQELSIKKSKIESDLGMPRNSLSGMMNGTKEIPDKWINPLTNYVHDARNELAAPKTKLVVTDKGVEEKPSDERMVKIRTLNAQLNKEFGEGTVMILGDSPTKKYDVISTGSLQLDIALGIGGLPRGRIVEIFGLESSGKTTIALNVIADAQRRGLKCFLVDAENSFDPEYAAALGIKVEELGYSQPSSGEQGLEVADRQISSGIYGVMVIDSVAALTPKAELEGAMGDSKMGLHARLMSQACRKMTASISKTNTLCIFINQIRNKIGGYGNPEVTTGGMALQFYSSVRLKVSRSISKENSLINGDITEGNKTEVKVIKNKCAPPFRKAEFYIMYGTGIDRTREVIDLAVEGKIIEKSGSWFSYQGSKLGQGINSVYDVFESNPELAAEIEKRVRFI